jgi:bifunctional UDP-N-acetylglucosamine pyrophosphorylase/glucosamine-1-phosphate N-acetyltransferase
MGTDGPARTAAVVLAAGLGTRMRSNRAKVLHEVGGLPLVAWSCRAAARVASRTVVVVGHERSLVREALEGSGAIFAVQDEQLGTGHALACAAPALEDFERIVVLAGDVPRLRGETLEALVAEHASRRASRRASATVLTFRPGDPSGYGRILRDSAGLVAGIVEHAQATPEERTIGEVNAGVYAFEAGDVLPLLASLPRHGRGREAYLTDVIATLVRDGRVVAAIEAPEHEVAGVNTQAQLAELEAAYQRERRAALMESGVTLTDPASAWVSADSTVAPGTTLRAAVALEGATSVGPRCDVGPLVRLRDVVVEEGCVLRGPLALEGRELAAGTCVAPTA